MNYVITKLDRRYAYHGQFPYMIEFRKNTEWGLGTGVLDFDRVRKWMNETWGWSQDIETRAEMVKSKVRMNKIDDGFADINRYWAYSCRYQEYRIYVNEAAVAMFKLKWSQDATA
jgi:hypothetical protein